MSNRFCVVYFWRALVAKIMEISVPVAYYQLFELYSTRCFYLPSWYVNDRDVLCTHKCLIKLQIHVYTWCSRVRRSAALSSNVMTPPLVLRHKHATLSEKLTNTSSSDKALINYNKRYVDGVSRLLTNLIKKNRCIWHWDG